jgi:hypothetical protein
MSQRPPPMRWGSLVFKRGAAGGGERLLTCQPLIGSRAEIT